MRLAADRIAASLKRLDFAEAPVWAAAQQRLLSRLLAAPATAAATGGGCGDGATMPPSTAGEHNGDGADDASLKARLAAAVAAAQAAQPAVPIEAEGLPFEEPRPKVGRGRECIPFAAEGC